MTLKKLQEHTGRICEPICDFAFLVLYDQHTPVYVGATDRSVFAPNTQHLSAKEFHSFKMFVDDLKVFLSEDKL